MQTTREFIEAIRAKHDGCSYYRVTQILEVVPSAIRRWRSGQGGFANDVGLRVAKELNLSPAYVLACLESEREQSAEVRPVWAAIAKKFAGKSAGILVAGFVALGGAHDAQALENKGFALPYPAEASSPSLYIMVNKVCTEARAYHRPIHSDSSHPLPLNNHQPLARDHRVPDPKRACSASSDVFQTHC